MLSDGNASLSAPSGFVVWQCIQSSAYCPVAVPGSTTMFHGMGEHVTVIFEMTCKLPVGHILTVCATRRLFQLSFIRSATLTPGRICTPTWCCQVHDQFPKGAASA